jgi:hypothetical protein
VTPVTENRADLTKIRANSRAGENTMKALVIGLVFIASASALQSMTLLERTPPVEPARVSAADLLFARHFCRAQYNNPLDRDACMGRLSAHTVHSIETGTDVDER